MNANIRRAAKKATQSKAPQSRAMSASLRRLAAKRTAHALAVGAMLAFGTTSAHAQYVYSGPTPGTTAVPITGNFTGGFTNGATTYTSPPQGSIATILTFGGSGSTGYTATDDITAGNGFVANQLIFNSSATTTIVAGTGGGSPYFFNLNVNGATNAAVTQNGSGAININEDITAGGTTVFGGTGTGTVTLNGALGNASASIYKTGSYELVLAQAGTFSKTLFINTIGASQANNGTVLLTNGQALGTGSVSIGIGGNAETGTLALQGGITVANAVKFNTARSGGTNVLNAPQLESISGNNTMTGNFTGFGGGGTGYAVQSDANLLTLTGTFTALTHALYFQGAGDGIATGVLSGGGIINKAGAGTWTLTGANTNTGAINVYGGILSGTTASLNSGSSAALSSGATLDFTQSANGTYSKVISGAGAVTIGGNPTLSNATANPAGTGGTVIFSGANAYSGGTTVSAGTLSLAGAADANNATGTGGIIVTGDGSNNGAASATLGVLQLAATNQIADAAPITLNGGAINTQSSSEGAAGTPGLGTLALTNPNGTFSFLDYGTAGATNGVNSTLAFANSTATLGTGVLQVVNYEYGSALGAASSFDHLYFGTDNTTTPLSQAQLADIQFFNPTGQTGTYSATQLANGEVVPFTNIAPTPEPGGLIPLIVGIAGTGVLVARRRRKAKTENCQNELADAV